MLRKPPRQALHLSACSTRTHRWQLMEKRKKPIQHLLVHNLFPLSKGDGLHSFACIQRISFSSESLSSTGPIKESKIENQNELLSKTISLNASSLSSLDGASDHVKSSINNISSREKNLISKKKKLPSISKMMHELDIQGKNISKESKNENIQGAPSSPQTKPSPIATAIDKDLLEKIDVKSEEAPQLDLIVNKDMEGPSQTLTNSANHTSDAFEARESNVKPKLLRPSNPISPDISFLFGNIAQQCNGSVLAKSGGTTVFSTVVIEKGGSRIPCSDFIPMIVDYRERYHSVGRIPKSRNRRDNIGAPTTSEILAARAIDRVLRPLLPPELYNSDDSIKVTCSVQSYNINELASKGKPSDPIALAINSASAALVDSGLPFEGPAGCVRVSLSKNGEMVRDPSPEELKNSSIDLLYAGTQNNALMVEFSSKPEENRSSVGVVGIPEEQVTEFIKFAHDSIQDIIRSQQSLPRQSPAENEAKLIQKSREILGLPNRHTISSSTQVLDLVNDAFDFISENLRDAVYRHFSGSHIDKQFQSKKYRGLREYVLRDEISTLIASRYQSISNDERKYLENVVSKKLFKKAIQDASFENSRSDGRNLDCVRPVSMVVPSLPVSVHGSSCFTRGETQVLCSVTLGAPREGLPLSGAYSLSVGESSTEKTREENKESPVGSLRSTKNEISLLSDLNSRKMIADHEHTGESGTFHELQRGFLHYDFPPFSTGETGSNKSMGLNRREIGHGALAERAILCVLPPISLFPYSIRITSEVTSSNGSSSMATTCGVTLALLDAGVRLLAPIAGISVGLVVRDDIDSSLLKDENSYSILVDITGTEDHYGEMDLKTAGTHHGITAMQLDVKYRGGIPISIISKALTKAKVGRLQILEDMADSTKGGLPGLYPRIGLKPTAPRVEIIKFDPIRKRDLIGPGGAVLRQLEECFDVSLDLSQDGKCLLHGTNSEMVGRAKSVVMDLVADVEEGGVYEGIVIEVKDFGAVVELLRNKEGLLHVSEMTDSEKLRNHPDGNLGIVKSIVKLGDRIRVKCIGVDPIQGSIKLSKKQLDESDPLYTYSSASSNTEDIFSQSRNEVRREQPALPPPADWMTDFLKPNPSDSSKGEGSTGKKKKKRNSRKRTKKRSKT